MDRTSTLDRIIDGDKNKELKKVLVAWRCTFETLNTAIQEGYDGILVHEPTYFLHADEVESLTALPDDSPRKITAARKQLLIQENDLVVIRIHDSWDPRDEIGVAASWAKSLGLNNLVFKSQPMDCECRYDIAPTTAGAFLEIVKAAVKGYQIPEPCLFGSPEQTISRVGLGAGCIANVEVFIKMGCDIAIVCNDGLWYWQDITFALDRGFPVIQVSHAAAEEAGIQALAVWVQNTFGIESTYIQEKACK